MPWLWNWTERFLSIMVFILTFLMIMVRWEGGVQRITMLVFWVAQFEIEAEISLSITNAEVELFLATAPGPDFHDLMEAAEKESFFCVLTSRAR